MNDRKRKKTGDPRIDLYKTGDPTIDSEIQSLWHHKAYVAWYHLVDLMKEFSIWWDWGAVNQLSNVLKLFEEHMCIKPAIGVRLKEYDEGTRYPSGTVESAHIIFSDLKELRDISDEEGHVVIPVRRIKDIEGKLADLCSMLTIVHPQWWRNEER